MNFRLPQIEAERVAARGMTRPREEVELVRLAQRALGGQLEFAARFDLFGVFLQ